MERQAIFLPFRGNQLERSFGVSLGNQNIAAMAVIRDSIRRRRVARKHDASVARCEAVAVSVHVPVPNGECRDSDIRILKDYPRLDLVYVHFPSGIVRVLHRRFGQDRRFRRRPMDEGAILSSTAARFCIPFGTISHDLS